MEIERYEGNEERDILVAMIINPKVLGKISVKWDGKNFKQRWCNLIGTLCVSHYRKFNKPPKKLISSLWDRKSTKMKDEVSVSLGEKFLHYLSDYYEQNGTKVNADYTLDLVDAHFKKVKCAELSEQINNALEAGDAIRAEEAITQFKLPALSGTSGVWLFEDESEVDAAFAEPPESLIKYPGDLGYFFRGALARECFVAFMGPDKSTKCVAEDSTVLLSDGRLRTIKELVENKKAFKVLSLDDKSQRFVEMPISQFWDNGIKDCWSVKTRSGRRLVTTLNHLYFTPDGWKELEILVPGDFIATARVLPTFGNERIDNDHVSFLAYMIADGCCRQCPTFTKFDPVLVSDFKSVCNRLGYLCNPAKKGAYRVSNSRNLLRRHGLMGKLSKEKTVPDAIFTCPKDQVALFLRVYFSCDGTIVNNKNEVRVGSASKVLAQQVSHLLTRFGIVHRLKYAPATLNEKRFKFWQIIISSREYLNQFLRDVNMMSYKQTIERPLEQCRSFLDKFPHQVASRFYDELVAECAGSSVPKRLAAKGKGKYVRSGHAFRQMFGRNKASYVRERLAKGETLMRQSFMHVNESSPSFQKYFNSHILWDEVVSIKPAGKKHTYDLGVTTYHNFVANDFIVHNSYRLLDLAYRAMIQKRKVAFFECGDLTRRQAEWRFWCRAAQSPLRSTNLNGMWPCIVRVPTKIEIGSKNEPLIKTEVRKFKGPLDGKQIKQAFLRLRKKLKTKINQYFKLFCYPADSISILEIKSIIQQEALEGWCPDCVVIDYADILASPSSKLDRRDQIDKTWKQLRSLSAEFHCLVVTATQSSSKAYFLLKDGELLNRTHFSEDKRKLAHVSGMIGINVSKMEKDVGAARLNWIELRDYDEGPPVHVVGCLALANPNMRSVLGERH